MTNITTRDLAKEPRSEPVPPRIPAAPAAKGSAKRNSIFAADRPYGADALGRSGLLRPLAELAVHRDTETPLTIALFGQSGSGKSFALGKLLAEIQSLTSLKREASPFLARVALLRIDAASLDGEPAVALASALYDRLEAEYPEFVREIGHAVRDPQVVAREAAERLDDARRRLDAERQKLEEIEGRRARLAETVLFESAGSQVDAYARANRGKIESRLEVFGISGDAIANYKSMVRDAAESGGPAGRMGAALRAFWALNGQIRLLITATVLVLIGIGLNIAVADQAKWLAWLRDTRGGLGSLADWFEAHIGWLSLAATALFVGAGLALFVNLVRGVGFLRPLFRGVHLLEADVSNRRRALDSLYAHQMRRVDGLEADVELAARRAAEADRRAGAPSRSTGQAEPPPFGDAPLKVQADRFFTALGTYLEGVERSAVVPGGLSSVPQRLVVALDEIDILPLERIRALLDAAYRAFASGGVVALLAADSSRLLAAAEADGTALERWIQVPLRIDANATDPGAFVAHVIGAKDAEQRSEGQPVNWAVAAPEVDLLAALAPLAGGSPRAVKRFVNLYRIARSQMPEHWGVLALMLALEQGGTSDEIAAVKNALHGQPDTELDIQHATARLETALRAMRSLEGSASVVSAGHAAAVARIFSLRVR